MKTLSFPDVQKWSDLFEGPFPTDTTDIVLEYRSEGKAKAERMRVGGSLYMDYRKGPHFVTVYVKPTDKVIDYIYQHMLLIDNDSLFFKAIQWEDGRWLITVSHNKILGDRWLAVLPNTEMPTPEGINK